MATVSEALAAALDHHMAGRVQEAGILYRRILDVDPENAHALHLCGVLCAQAGRAVEAVDLIGRAIAHAPGVPDFHVNLANALRAAGRPAEAVDAYRQALALAPGRADAGFGLALALESCGRLEDAVAAYRSLLRHQPGHADALGKLGAALRELILRHRPAAPARTDALLRQVLALAPADAVAWNELGLSLGRQARAADAVRALRRATVAQPDLEAASGNLGIALCNTGQADAALAPARRAVALQPGDVGGLGNLALVSEQLARLDDAATANRRALAVAPLDAVTWLNQGMLLRRAGRIVAAAAACERALALAPAAAGAWLNRATAVLDDGRIAAAVADYRRALVLEPDNAAYHSNLLLTLQYSPDHTVADLLAEHRAWDARHGRPRAALAVPPANAPDPERRLRVGYVSADLGYHPVGYFLAPVLPAHDRHAVEVFCYSAKREDGLTRRLRAASDHWRPIHGLDDAALAAMIAADGIDILVDLAGHTAGNRLPLFARKPAPVQVTWAGYVGTTGMAAMDALIADPRHMPPGTEWTAVERVVRLPDSYVCVMPRENAPDVGPPPTLANGHVTFGCFNNRNKLSTPTLSLWATLLNRLPTARLLLKTHQLDDPQVCANLRAAFAALGGDPDRVEMSGRAAHADLPAWYGRVDVALDPFPYSGGLTTLEALWMGVPVVTLAGGDRFCSRHSVGHLTAAGLERCIAPDAAAYVGIAAALAEDLPGLATLRAGLRARMAASPLCDGPRFARNLEAAYRDLWRAWCATRR